jgi:hypothetical protein
MGLVAVSAGITSMVGGAAIIPGSPEVAASVDSELRFYAAWYAAAGVALLWSAGRVESSGAIIRGVAATFFLAGCSRIVSIVDVGRPHDWFVFLMVVELLIPLVVIPWQAAVARSTR